MRSTQRTSKSATYIFNLETSCHSAAPMPPPSVPQTLRSPRPGDCTRGFLASWRQCIQDGTLDVQGGGQSATELRRIQDGAGCSGY